MASTEQTPQPPAEELPPIPERFIRGCLGDMVEAERRWKITVEWRRAHGVDAILQEKFPEFTRIKEYYPHFVFRRSKEGYLVYYERLGKIDIAKMRAHGISMERLVRYYIFLTEFMWTRLDPRPDGKVVTVMDVEGVGLKDLQGEALQFMRTASDIMQEHYVERSAKILVINAPMVFSFVWKVVSPWINERTRQKISIVGGDYKKKLSEFIEMEHVPSMYGGHDPRHPYESPEEAALREYVEALLKDEEARALAVAAQGTEGAAVTDGGIPEVADPPMQAQTAQA